MQTLESFKNYISKLDTKWKSIDKLIRSNFPNIQFRKNFGSTKTTAKYEWYFTTDYENKTFGIKITYNSSDIINRPSIDIVCKSLPYAVKFTEYNMKYDDFMINGLKKIKLFIKLSFNDIMDFEMSEKQFKIGKEREGKALKTLKDELSLEDLEEILSDIKDLSIVDYKTELKLSTYPKLSAFYEINFEIKENSDILDEYSDFFKILNNSIKRIKSTYNVITNWNFKQLRLTIHIDETSYLPQ
jgi:hypothetical protein